MAFHLEETKLSAPTTAVDESRVLLAGWSTGTGARRGGTERSNGSTETEYVAASLTGVAICALAVALSVVLPGRQRRATDSGSGAVDVVGAEESNADALPAVRPKPVRRHPGSPPGAACASIPASRRRGWRGRR
jgi:hypothetical protein